MLYERTTHSYGAKRILGDMERADAPTAPQYSLWHVPTGTLLVATDERDEAMRMEATLLATGMAARHLRLDRAAATSHPDRATATVLRAAFSKWH